MDALAIFLIPGLAMAFALGVLALFHTTVSAIVIGFGAVLIGIAVDFAMHVYFAMIHNPESPESAIRAVRKPIFFCALTSCVAFGALFASGIPAIRQLALYAIAGLFASMLLSLLLVPQVVRPRQVQTQATRNRRSFRPGVALTLWGVVMAGCIIGGSTVHIDPDLRAIGYVADSVRETERRFAETWGDTRNKGVVFAHGDTLEVALQKNEAVRNALARYVPDLTVASLADLLPSLTTQAKSRGRWEAFWTDRNREEMREVLNRESRGMGFSNTAFHQFEESLESWPNPITPEKMDAASLGLIRQMFMPTSTTLVTFVPDSANALAFFSPGREAELGVRFVSNSRFKAELETTMKQDIVRFISISAGAVVLLAFILFRHPRRVALALLPAATGIGAVFAYLGLSHTALNLFHITALPLVIGLGADYGIFLLCREGQSLDLATIRAVTASGLTTLAGFGVLVLARHPSLHSMGVTVLVGIGAALTCALFLLPNLIRRTA